MLSDSNHRHEINCILNNQVQASILFSRPVRNMTQHYEFDPRIEMLFLHAEAIYKKSFDTQGDENINMEKQQPQ